MAKRESFELDGHAHGSLPIPAVSRVGNLIATGGIRGVDRLTGEMSDELEQQVEHMFANMIAAVERAGGSAATILKVTIYAGAATVRPMLNGPWLRHFSDTHSRPARHVIETPGLAGRMLVQCEALALAEEE